MGVIVYSGNNWLPCEHAKEFLRSHGIEFDDIKVEELDNPLDTIRAHTGGPVGTPTVIIDGEARIGFDPQWMGERLGLDTNES